MKLFIQNEITHYKEWRKGILMFAPLELLLVIVVLGLFIMTVAVCTKFTKSSSSITALKMHLNALHSRFQEPAPMDAQIERGKLEILLNAVKSNSDQKVISGNIDLKAMLDRVCKQIQFIIERKEPGSRSSWQQFKDVTFGFYEVYFSKTA